MASRRARTAEARAPKTPGGALAELRPALERLDLLLKRAVVAAAEVYGAEAASDRFRGLYVGDAEVVRLLNRAPGEPLLARAVPPSSARQSVASKGLRLAWLASKYGLSNFDLDVLLIALAPELDLKYERLYGYLQDDVTRKRPTVDLALNLLCSTAEEKLDRQAHFAAGSPLVRHSLIHLVPDPNQVAPPSLACYVRIDEQIARHLLGKSGLDQRLAAFCRIIEPSDSRHADHAQSAVRSLRPLAVEAVQGDRPFRVYVRARKGGGQLEAGTWLARQLGKALLTVNLSHLDSDKSFSVAFREAGFHGAVLYAEPFEALKTPERATALEAFLNEVEMSRGIVFLAGAEPWSPGRPRLGVVSVDLRDPGNDASKAVWTESLAASGLSPRTRDLEALQALFRFTPDQIADTVETATAYRRMTPLRRNRPAEDAVREALFAAAREQSGHDLAKLTVKIRPVYTWSDLILPTDVTDQLREICARIRLRDHVFEDWGFGRKLSLNKGVTALLAGPPGTGKTMAAEVIANELGVDLYKLNLSTVYSKWVGETEKALDRVFAAAETSNAILAIDECESLFNKRSSEGGRGDALERFSNAEISYLLQRLESSDATVLLTTNLHTAIDEAFIRRLSFSVHFPFPPESDRRKIWAGVWPKETRLSDDLELDVVARHFPLAGGSIRNIALAAAFLAAGENGGFVTATHVLRATQREFQKLGKTLSPAELALPRASDARIMNA